MLPQGAAAGEAEPSGALALQGILQAAQAGNADAFALTGLNAGADMAAGAAQSMLLGLIPTAEIDIRFSDEYDVQGSVLLLAPIMESADGRNILFTQASLFRFDGRTTANIGLGYRRLAFDERVLLGVNGFFDHEWPYRHSRAGLGAELRTTVGEINANYYRGLSGWKSGANGLEERAMDGWDVELGAPLPYLPRTRLYGSYFRWEAQSGTFSEDGYRYSLEGEVYPGVTVEVGRRHFQKSEDESFAAIRVDVVDLLLPPREPQPFIADTAWRFGSMRARKYDKVRRENLIRKETRVPGSFTVTASGF